MSGLVEKLEAAEVGSRALDALIWLRLNRPEYQGGVKALEMRTWYDGCGHLILETDAGEEVADELGIAPVTTSLDAALALVPERVFWSLKGPHFGVFKAAIYSRQTPFRGVGRTAPLSVCIAVLKAYEVRALNLNETRHAE